MTVLLGQGDASEGGQGLHPKFAHSEGFVKRPQRGDVELESWADLPESVKTAVLEMVGGYSSSGS